MLKMSQRGNSATIADQRNMDEVLKKVKLQSEVYYERVGKKEDLQIVGIGDNLFKTDA